MADLGIGDLTIGYSFSGAVEYVNMLNAKAITETKEKLDDTSGIETALAKGWSGNAHLNFITNLNNSVKETQGILDSLKRAFDSQFAQIEENIVEQDKNMISID